MSSTKKQSKPTIEHGAKRGVLESYPIRDHCEMCGATRRQVANLPLEPAFKPNGEPATLCYLCRIGSAELLQNRAKAAKLNASELATTLAALRFWQSKIGPEDLPAQANAEGEYDPFFEDAPSLSSDQIDALCERLNS